MNKDLCEKVTKSINIENFDEKITKKMFSIMIDSISCCMKKKERIVLKNFGTFSVKKRNAYDTVNPSNGKPMNVSERYKIYFKTSKVLK